MRFQSSLSTYSHDSQRKKKNQSQRDCKSLKERKNYYDSFNLFNPEGTIHLLLKGDILTSYEQLKSESCQRNIEMSHFLQFRNVTFSVKNSSSFSLSFFAPFFLSLCQFCP